MEKLSRPEFRALFRECTRHAFHLEMKDAYGVVEEDEPFRKFLAGEPVDQAYRAGWFELIRDVTDAGVVVRRARVVTEPLDDYARFLLHITPGNIAAGEDVRYLPRDKAEGINLPVEDCWLFDDSVLTLVMFHDSGRMDGFYVADDPVLVKRYSEACTQVWERAIPFGDYVRGQ